MRHISILVALLLYGLIGHNGARGQPCEPQWSEAFTFGLPDGPVRTMAVLDDGSGPALYVGGFFKTLGGVAAGGVARWDGFRWDNLGGGTNGAVYAMTVYDDGKGPALYVGGYFSEAGGMAARNLARWDGATWKPLGPTAPQIRALAVCDTGSGPELYVGALAPSLFGVSGWIARWNGVSWKPLGGGLDGAVRALVVEGAGDEQFITVGGDFTHAGGKTAGRIARWNGSGWFTLGQEGANDSVLSLAIANLGDGPRLYAGGKFTGIGGVGAPFVACWNGAHWGSLGAGIWAEELQWASVNAFAVFDDGSGPSLFVGGDFDRAGTVDTTDVARWDGQKWHGMAGGIVPDTEPRWVGGLATFDTPNGARLFVGGDFKRLYQPSWIYPHLTTWDGGAWHSPPNRGVNLAAWDDTGGEARAFATFDDGTGPAVYVTGSFTRAGDQPAENIARFDGVDWGPSMPGIQKYGLALEVFDDGSGPALYVGGYFDLPAGGLARWDGQGWSDVGGSLWFPGFEDPAVLDIQIFDDGGGAALVVGGVFQRAGQTDVLSIAAWDGEAWGALGAGFGTNGVDGRVESLAVFDDGGGAALFAGGAFTQSGGEPLHFIARWDGAGWVDVGGGFDQTVTSLQVFDDGSGPALCATGEFNVAGGIPVKGIARWDGAQWSPIGNGLPTHGLKLAAYDDGSGPALYATLAGPAMLGLYRWDGMAWTVVSDDAVEFLGTASDSLGPALYCGTDNVINGISSRGIARFGCTEGPACTADCDWSGVLDLFDFLCFVNLFNAGAPQADCDLSGGLDLFDFLCFVNAFNAGC
jgi:trimeric autotransporter adhesin